MENAEFFVLVDQIGPIFRDSFDIEISEGDGSTVGAVFVSPARKGWEKRTKHESAVGAAQSVQAV